jgi:hypothetical protein
VENQTEEKSSVSGLVKEKNIPTTISKHFSKIMASLAKRLFHREMKFLSRRIKLF